MIPSCPYNTYDRCKSEPPVRFKMICLLSGKKLKGQGWLCEMCASAFYVVWTDRDQKTVKGKKIPKFDGRPMMWLSTDDALEIRYGDRAFHRHECYCNRTHTWYTFDGEMSPKEIIESGDLFMGYI